MHGRNQQPTGNGGARARRTCHHLRPSLRHRRRAGGAGLAALAVLAAACNEPVGPGGPTDSEIAVLNSVSSTLQQFNRIDDRLVPFGQDKPLGAAYRGASADFIQDLWVTTSEPEDGGESEILFGSFSTDESRRVVFPDAARGNPGRPTAIVDLSGNVGALVPARSEGAVYIAFPGNPTASLLIEGAGQFVERAIAYGRSIVSMDANLGEDGLPLGPPHVSTRDFDTGRLTVPLLPLPEGTVGVTDALVREDNLVLLAGGSGNPAVSPAGDGVFFEINLTANRVREMHPLGGNGVSLEGGRSGLVFVVRTKGTSTDTDVLSYNFSSGEFVRGPNNPLQPQDEDGRNLNCRVVTGFLDGQLLCATYAEAGPGRLVLLTEEGGYISETAIGAGATDILLR